MSFNVTAELEISVSFILHTVIRQDPMSQSICLRSSIMSYFHFSSSLLCEHFRRYVSTKILYVFVIMWADCRLLSFLCYNTLAIT